VGTGDGLLWCKKARIRFPGAARPFFNMLIFVCDQGCRKWTRPNTGGDYFEDCLRLANCAIQSVAVREPDTQRCGSQGAGALEETTALGSERGRSACP